jgi:hypothetical protein
VIPVDNRSQRPVKPKVDTSSWAVIPGMCYTSCDASDGYALESAVSVNLRQERSGTFRSGAAEELNTGPALSDASLIHEDDPICDFRANPFQG